MNGKKLIGMLAALVVLVGIASLQKQRVRKNRPVHANAQATLLQGVDLNQIDRLEIAEDSNTVSLAKQAGKWVVRSLYDYPADFGKLADALRAAADVKLGRPVRAANVEESEFGLDAAMSIAVKSGGQDAATLEVGTRRAASDAAGWSNQRFVRKGNAGDVYLVDYDFRPFVADASDWIETELLHVRSSDIVSVKVGDVELHSVGDTWTLADLDETTEELESSEANRLRMALQYLNCTAVADPAGSDAELGFTNAVVYTASTTNKTYTVAVGGETEEGRYLRLAGDVPEQLKNWTYVVGSYKANDFLITRDKLVKPRESLDEDGSTEELSAE